MNDITQDRSPLPADDPSRTMTLVHADGPDLRHVSVVGDTYTIRLDGTQTANRYCLIDMFVPQGGGPPPHRHDFEETFIVLEGEIEATFRGEKTTVRAGETLHVPANAPHSFTNSAAAPARLLCTCSPSGQEEFFLLIGKLVPTRTSPPPPMSDEEKAATMKLASELAPKYWTE
ncbi:cupin domain-containing protein, partial [bacterium]